MARKFAKKVLAFAKESQYGQDAITGGEAQFVLGREVTITPMAGESATLDYDDGRLGNSAELVTELYVTLEFGCDFCAATDPDQPAAWSDLLQACLRKTQTGGSEVSYALDDDGTGSNTFHFYMDGTLHALVGARGSVKLSMAAKAFPELRFTFTGLHVPVTSKSNPGGDFSDWRPPCKVGSQYTSATLAGKAIKLISLEYDQANQVSHEEFVGHEEVMISDYQPTGTLVLEAEGLGTFNPFQLAEQGAEVAFSLSHGEAGNQVGWSTTRLQLGRATYADQNGILTYSIPIRPLGDVDLFTSA